MAKDDFLIQPRRVPILEPGFRPAVIANRAFSRLVTDRGGREVAIALERQQERVSVVRARVLREDDPFAMLNYAFIERLLKFLLWQRGGWKIKICGAPELSHFLQYTYSPLGPRSFDQAFWTGVYGRSFCIESVNASEIPAVAEGEGGIVDLHWSGWRIGFDLGASDRKVAVVKDGRLALTATGSPVLSEELPWDPKPQTDPSWHYTKILEILELAKGRIMQIDPEAVVQGIGGSSAGIYVNNRVRAASLFRGISDPAVFEREVSGIFERISHAMGGVPFRLENDGDVTALAGAISLGDGAVLGLAMGSSLAAGYVDDQTRIAGWMNELAFAPVDYSQTAPVDEWSGDRGVGASYFSQQAVGRLIDKAGITMDDIPAGSLPERLVRVQELMEHGDERAKRIYETIGTCFGYAVAQYADFYPAVRHVEVLGRVMTGDGGQIILATAREVLREEFPELFHRMDFYEPDEREKRHGQAAAAASLPLVKTPPL